MADFLDTLSGVLNQQFLTGENELHSLDISQDGHTQRYGKLGDFANSFDQSAQRSYTQEGYSRLHYSDAKPKQLDILMQEPETTVLVKKRAFASLAENFRPELMDGQERLFLKSTKILFQNKCKQIAAFEQLSKISHISTQIGQVDYHLLPILFSITDDLADGLSPISGLFGDSLKGFKNTVDKVREVVALNQDFYYTTWHTNLNTSFKTDFGEGTGVIELTNVSDFSTTTTLQFGKGSFTVNFSDPYKLMLITNNDIEQAISDATNRAYDNSFLSIGSLGQDTLDFQKKELNQLRVSRGANPIIFIVEPGTFLGKRVRAIIDIIGFEINFDASSAGNFIGAITGAGNKIDPSALKGSEALGAQGLDGDEADIFSNIVSSIFNQLSLSANSKRQVNYKQSGGDVDLNELRRQLRLHYMTKSIVQPMDTVSIFVSSKKKLDSKIVGGLQGGFSGLGFLQGITNLTQNIKNTLNTMDGSSIEKAVFVGSDFPNWLWQSMRSKFVADKEGACIFTGVTETVRSDYNSGSYKVSIAGGDNAKYFDYGLVNIKPSADVYNGPLYDPLTPFKLKFDSASGIANSTPDLLDENHNIFNSDFVKNKNGLLAGIQGNARNYIIPDNDVVKNTNVRNVFYDPEGMVYRWKQGIATLVLFGDSYDPNVGNKGQAITNDPFAGQDIMNVLSLLITGEPYNYGTFYNTARQFDNLNRDPITNQLAAASYFRGLRNDLKNRNAIYGDFIPFKLLTMDEATYQKVLGGQMKVINFDYELQLLLEKRATLADRISLINDPAIENSIRSELVNIDQNIALKNNSISKELSNQDNSAIKVLGNDISYDQDLVGLNSQSKSNIKNDGGRKELRKKLSFLTRRLAWKVRANEDLNLFIVDDAYDKDYDIQAFEKSFVNDFSLFRSEYTTVSQQIEKISNIGMGLEIFANSQGHIEIRNPKYNRMPGSVFYKMIKMKDETGVQVFPQFIEDLFKNQLQELFNQISILEIQIRLYCSALGYNDDIKCANFINTIDQTSTNTIINGGSNFSFISDDTGEITDMSKLSDKSVDPEVAFQPLQSSLSSQTSLTGFSLSGRSKFIQLAAPATGNIQLKSRQQLLSEQAQDTRVTNLKNQLNMKTGGQTFDFAQLFGVSDAEIQTKNVSIINILHIVNQIADFLSERQKAIKTASNALKNIIEGSSLNKDKTGNTLLFPSLTENKSIPQIFDHMLEDESYDDLGVGSGSRYVLRDRDIISHSLTEKAPPFTSIEVTGRAGDLFFNNSNLPSDLGIFQNGGNAMITAAAVDYDLWRMYGMRLPQHIDAPFLQDPDTQLAPYAVSILNKSRKEILSGTISIVGNEYQQPGEVVYVEDLDLLLYIDTVSHNFNNGRGFQTSLTVGYGHHPGEYIPTPLDVIGKILYKNNKKTTNIENRRQGNIFNQEHLGTFVVNTSDSISNTNEAFDNKYQVSNGVILQNIINQAAGPLSQQSENLKTTLELRMYYNSTKRFPDINFNLQEVSQLIRNRLLGLENIDSSSISINMTNPSSKNNGLGSFSEQIKYLTVDVGADGEFRYPSQQAFYLAKQILNDPSSVGGGNSLSSFTNIDETVNSTGAAVNQAQNKIDQQIYNYIIDVWIYSENPNN